MAKVININPEDINIISEVIDTLVKQKEELKDICILIKYKNDDMIFLHNEPNFETKCSMSKLLDFDIMSELQEDNEA